MLHPQKEESRSPEKDLFSRLGRMLERVDEEVSAPSQSPVCQQMRSSDGAEGSAALPDSASTRSRSLGSPAGMLSQPGPAGSIPARSWGCRQPVAQEEGGQQTFPKEPALLWAGHRPRGLAVQA